MWTEWIMIPDRYGVGWVVRWYWVNFQCRGVLLIWIIVGQGPTALVVGADGVCLDIFSPVYHLSPLSPSFWETARYRLKYSLKGPLNPKQPTNQPSSLGRSDALTTSGVQRHTKYFKFILLLTRYFKITKVLVVSKSLP